MKRIANKTKSMQSIENITGEDIEETLRRLFVDENKTHKQISNELNLSYVTVIKWLHLAGVRSRKLDVS